MTPETRVALVLLLTAPACVRGEPERTVDPTTPFPVSIQALAEDHGPVAGVEISSAAQPLGRTDVQGHLELALRGDEGERTTLTAHCPAGFASPERPLVVGLRRLSAGSPPPQFRVECLRLVHSVLVGVLAENGPHLPILHLKQQVGETDEHGVAHVLLPASNDERFTLTLDTTRNPSLRPQNPSLGFITRDHDEFVLLEHKFAVERPKAVHVVRRRGPQPL